MAPGIKKTWRRSSDSAKNNKPVLVIIAGKSGAGKTTAAKLISKKIHAKVFSTDQIRRTKEFKIIAAPYQKTGKLFPSWLRHRFYRELMERAQKQLKHGRNVILDATFSEPWMFQMANHIAMGSSARVVAVEVIIKKLNERKIMERLTRRVKRDKGAALPKTFWAYPSRRYLKVRSAITIRNDGTILTLRRQVGRMLKRIKI